MKALNRRSNTKKPKTVPQPPPAPVVKSPYIPRTPITEAAKLAMYRQAEQYWADETDYYGYDLGRPDNVIARMAAILGAVDAETAQDALQRCKQTMQTMILGAWAQGKISGPTNIFTLEKRIKKAENLALMLEQKELYDQADAQWARARELKVQLKNLRQEKNAD